MSIKKSFLFVALSITLGLTLWHCSPTTPNGGLKGTACASHIDCALGKICRHGVCELAKPEDIQMYTMGRDGGHADDIDLPDTPLTDSPDKPSVVSGNAGRSPDAAPSDETITSDALGDLTSGRAPKATPRRVPPPREPKPTDTGSKTDDTKASPKGCKTGDTQACYPRDTIGCSGSKDHQFDCIAPCTPGKRVCKAGVWGKCEGARTPKSKTKCVQVPAQRPKPCPDGKEGPNGRCR